MAIKHKYTLMCDEVRQEMNGKFMLIGLYTPNISLAQLPAMLPALTFFVCLESDRPENLQFRMRLANLETGQKVAEGMGAIGFQRPGFGISILRMPNVMFQATGTYTFEFTIEGEQPITTTFDVELIQIQMQAAQQFRR